MQIKISAQGHENLNTALGRAVARTFFAPGRARNWRPIRKIIWTYGTTVLIKHVPCIADRLDNMGIKRQILQSEKKIDSFFYGFSQGVPFLSKFYLKFHLSYFLVEYLLYHITVITKLAPCIFCA